MTREDKLIAMNGAMLIEVADKLGVKVSCNKTRTSLKEAKAKVVARILEAEAALLDDTTNESENAETESTQEVTAEAENTQEPESTVETESQQKSDATQEVKKATTEEQKTGETMKMSETIKILEDLFDKLNALYFADSPLDKPVITVQSTPRAYDHCSTKKIWKGTDEAFYEINIGAEFINRPIESTAATLLHEMVHLYCLENNIADTCQKGRYHNGKFRNECEARDLAVEYDLANGYAYTSPTDTFVEKLKAAGVDMTIKFARVAPTKKVKAERAATHKYICPCCGQSFRTTAILNIKCGDCDEVMECI
jgi:hypothetical protein